MTLNTQLPVPLPPQLAFWSFPLSCPFICFSLELFHHLSLCLLSRPSRCPSHLFCPSVSRFFCFLTSPPMSPVFLSVPIPLTQCPIICLSYFLLTSQSSHLLVCMIASMTSCFFPLVLMSNCSPCLFNSVHVFSTCFSSHAVCLVISCAAVYLQAGPLVAAFSSPLEGHVGVTESFEEPNAAPGHCELHLHIGRHATVPEGL